jgi:hypothetical protein
MRSSAGLIPLDTDPYGAFVSQSGTTFLKAPKCAHLGWTGLR